MPVIKHPEWKPGDKVWWFGKPYTVRQVFRDDGDNKGYVSVYDEHYNMQESYPRAWQLVRRD
ncbi:MAG TPA: hypothetical protein VIY48_17830 [Candidatus Paceibacterota bacterium]